MIQPKDTWECTYCGHINSNDNSHCGKCSRVNKNKATITLKDIARISDAKSKCSTSRVRR
ncbi:hypothetical protein KKF61_07240 [Patescibacteria group bacterium]|nr:hypothetical protein [Patescibacteria group bacterium]